MSNDHVRRVRIAAGAAVLSMLAVAPSTGATTFVVPPGPGTPVQDAIDAASPGDTIRLLAGSYPETLVITKPIKLRGVRSTSVGPDVTIVGGGCGDPATIAIASDDVQIRGIAVNANHQGGVDVIGNRIKLTDVFVGTSCAVVSAPAVNVRSSTRVKLTKVWASGSPSKTIPAGIRIADTPQDGRIRVARCIGGNNAIGLLLENNGILSVRVGPGDYNFNVRGIVLQGTSRALVHHNTLIDNATSGIELDATSSANLILRNEISGSTTDVVDDGSANCWRKNTYGTGSVPACP